MNLNYFCIFLPPWPRKLRNSKNLKYRERANNFMIWFEFSAAISRISRENNCYPREVERSAKNCYWERLRFEHKVPECFKQWYNLRHFAIQTQTESLSLHSSFKLCLLCSCWEAPITAIKSICKTNQLCGVKLRISGRKFDILKI